jgi:peptidoglycan hydrolase CwlO-like protein
VPYTIKKGGFVRLVSVVLLSLFCVSGIFAQKAVNATKDDVSAVHAEVTGLKAEVESLKAALESATEASKNAHLEIKQSFDAKFQEIESAYQAEIARLEELFGPKKKK